MEPTRTCTENIMQSGHRLGLAALTGFLQHRVARPTMHLLVGVSTCTAPHPISSTPVGTVTINTSKQSRKH